MHKGTNGMLLPAVWSTMSFRKKLDELRFLIRCFPSMSFAREARDVIVTIKETCFPVMTALGT